MQDDSRLFQISVPIQPGNSGGPLFNALGDVIGITSSSLSALGMLVAQGTLPQNVNYAVKISYARLLLEAANVDTQDKGRPKGKNFDQYSDLLPTVCQVLATAEKDEATYSIQTKDVSLRSTVLMNGVPKITIRNNNPFYIRNVALIIAFSGQESSPAVRQLKIPWTITDLLPPGTDYEFDIFDEEAISTLVKHSNGSTDEWIPLVEVVEVQKVQVH
jgi:hypothetical protein